MNVKNKTKLSTLLLERYKSYFVDLLTCQSRENYQSIGRVEKVGHASEDRMSTPAETCSPEVMVSEKVKNERFDRMCQKCPSNRPEIPFLNTFSKWCCVITPAQERRETGRREETPGMADE